jgi:archaellum component FlaC
MTTVTESDIKDLKDLINSVKGDIKGIDNRITNLETRISTLENRFTTFEINQVEIKTKLANVEISSQKIPDLAEKVGELKNWKQIALTLGGALIGGVITYLVKTPNL